jgi:hypothetical protein
MLVIVHNFLCALVLSEQLLRPATTAAEHTMCCRTCLVSTYCAVITRDLSCSEENRRSAIVTTTMYLRDNSRNHA